MLPLEEAQKYLAIVRKRGKEKATLNRVCRMLRCKELYLMAYAKLYANKGALTPGTIPDDTVDGMSSRKIDASMEKLKEKTDQWKPTRRGYIPKKNGKLRPLGMPGWEDKLLQEVMRMVLEAYYEPQFRNSSHGFRPQRGCHTALDTIQKWKGTRWFIEGDIKGCFENIDHHVIIEILKRNIKDKDFLKLIRDMLKAGYMEEWKHYSNFSGTPQGGIISPLLANIVLNVLDVFVEDTLIPKYTKGKKRKANPEYERLSAKARRARKSGDSKRANELRREYTKLPSKMSNDENFRRLWYVRYADDTLFGLIGTQSEAMAIKEDFGNFLRTIKLELSEEKTLITHALTDKACFLNYEINYMEENSEIRKRKDRVKARTVNGGLWFGIPENVIKKWKAKVQKASKITYRSELLNRSDYDIISTYEVQLQGLINYSNRAHNVKNRMRFLRCVWEESLARTLAAKHKSKITTIYKRYLKYSTIDKRRILGMEIPREGKKPLIAVFGKKPIQRNTVKTIMDEEQTIYAKRNELLTRMLAETCELCGSQQQIEAHHIRKLANLKRNGKNTPQWMQKMIAIRRKTLFVCQKCHTNIHNGTYDGVALTKVGGRAK